uniref:Uncharacterized protein n=1 Tax=Trichuris muris TaxID=70415 RepID=A0A5S6Q803_TRIMR
MPKELDVAVDVAQVEIVGQLNINVCSEVTCSKRLFKGACYKQDNDFTKAGNFTPQLSGQRKICLRLAKVQISLLLVRQTYTMNLWHRQVADLCFLC